MRQLILIIVFAVLALIGVVFVYRFFVSGPDISVPAGDGERGERLVEYRKIKTLRLDSSMFSDPFLRLLSRPTPQEVPQGTSGRGNPFLPSR